MSGTLTRRDAILTVALCYLTATMEGVDLQSMAIAAPKMIAEFHLSPAQFGSAASMSLIGLLFGAIVGGRLADRVGRKWVLVGSLVGLGLFSLLTAHVHSFEPLLLARLLVGLGLGGGFPNLIALTSEVSNPGNRSTMVSLMYAGVPVGTVIGTTLTLAYGAAFQWRWIFYVGGFGPLALALLLLLLLPESAQFKIAAARERTTGRVSVAHALFAQGRLRATVLMWVSFFFTLLVLNLLTNWLNQLMAQRGLDRAQSTAVLLAFGIGSIFGSICFGLLSDARFRRWVSVFAYGGVALSLVGLSQLARFEYLVAAGFGAGFFVVGAQLVNYALAPRYYPVAIRGTGVGWTVAIGRLGSIFGPFLGGMLLQRGLPASAVLAAFIPGLLIAAVASSTLLFGLAPEDAPAPAIAKA
jgi:MFS transporter, AAHS family, 3-hydroxyphenylpropionic acid transporter